jgi:hypothetical protein
MEKEVKFFVFIVLVLGAVLLMGSVLQFKSPLTGFVTFEQSNSEAFNIEGAIFENTVLNENLIILEENQTEGSYISQIFNSENENSIWESLTFSGEGIDFQVRSCELSDCSDSSFIEGNLDNLNLTSQYFQYKVIFNLVQNVTSYLESASISYSIPEIVEEEFSISISSPVEGTEYSSSEISLEVSSNEEISLWQYSLNDGQRISFTSGEVISELSDGNYVIIIYANNTEGEEINQSLSFSVLIPSCNNDLSLCENEELCNEQEGYWYNEQCNEEEEIIEEVVEEESEEVTEEEVVEEEVVEEVPTEIPSEVLEVPQLVTSMEISGINDLRLSKKQSKQIVLNVKNNGNVNLNSCTLSLEESPISQLVSYSEEPFNLNVDNSKDLFLNLNVSEETEEGTNSLSFNIQCSQISKSHNIEVEIVPITFEFDILDVRKIGNIVRARYEIQEVSGGDQTMNIKFSLFDNESLKIAEVEKLVNLSANEKERFRIDIPINESLSGEIMIHLDINSQKYSSSVEESIVLNSMPILGFATVGEFITGTGGAITLIVVVLALISIIFIARRARKRRIVKKEKAKENIENTKEE